MDARVMGVDCYNLCTTGEIGRTLSTSGGGLNEHIPVLIMERDAQMDERVTILNPWDSQGNQITDGLGIYPCIRGCGGGGYQQGYVLQHLHEDQIVKCVMATGQPNAEITDGKISPTLTQLAGTGGNNVPMVVLGFDVYNMAETGEVSKTLSSSATDSDHIPIVCLNAWDSQSKHILSPEGVSEALCAGEKRWGALPPNILCLNDQGGSVMNTSDKAGCLRAQEHGHPPIVCYRKTGHPMNKDGYQGLEKTEVADTLNVYDNSECRTPIVICFEPGIARRLGGHSRFVPNVSTTLRANAGDNQPAVCYGIDQQGGKSNCGYAKNVMPTLCSDSHGTPHAVCYDARGNGDGKTVSTLTGGPLTSYGGGIRVDTPLILMKQDSPGIEDMEILNGGALRAPCVLPDTQN